MAYLDYYTHDQQDIVFGITDTPYPPDEDGHITPTVIKVLSPTHPDWAIFQAWLGDPASFDGTRWVGSANSTKLTSDPDSPWTQAKPVELTDKEMFEQILKMTVERVFSVFATSTSAMPTPSMTTADRDASSAVTAAGSIIWNSDNARPEIYMGGGVWQKISTSAG